MNANESLNANSLSQDEILMNEDELIAGLIQAANFREDKGYAKSDSRNF